MLLGGYSFYTKSFSLRNYQIYLISTLYDHCFVSAPPNLEYTFNMLLSYKTSLSCHVFVILIWLLDYIDYFSFSLVVLFPVIINKYYFQFASIYESKKDTPILFKLYSLMWAANQCLKIHLLLSTLYYWSRKIVITNILLSIRDLFVYRLTIIT